MSPVVGLVLNYRDPSRTTACVASLISAGISKILVFDNSAQDAGRLTGGDLLQFEGAEVALILSDTNLGFAAGVNRGFSDCLVRWPGHWVLLVNNDALLTVELPNRLFTALSGTPTAATACPMMLQDGSRIGWMWYQPWLGLISSRQLPGSFPFASGCCQLIATERVGPVPFDEDFFMYGEDVELAWRLRRQHQMQLLVEDCTVLHEGSASSRRGSLFYETLLVECHLKLARKFSLGQPLKYSTMLGLRAVTLSLRAIIRGFRSMSLTPFRALQLGVRRALAITKAEDSSHALIPRRKSENRWQD